MSLFRKLSRAFRSSRLRLAEQDLAWMEEVGIRNLIAQRARVAEMRTALALDTNSDDIARRISKRERGVILQGQP